MTRFVRQSVGCLVGPIGALVPFFVHLRLGICYGEEGEEEEATIYLDKAEQIFR